MTTHDDIATAIDATARILADRDIRAANERADKWMDAGRKFWDIRDWLRVCEDSPEGHAEFYRECARIVFGPEEGEAA
ncbi:MULTISPECIES: hypothetical protein [Nocardia]|uniref:hypothetical protein n=1 Tax=Nocardia TaxID=1817 RepID=UPI000D69E113|nr:MULTISPECIES: hypothetical protein [Nocardia]